MLAAGKQSPNGVLEGHDSVVHERGRARVTEA
jgi:hypothetical protein